MSGPVGTAQKNSARKPQPDIITSIAALHQSNQFAQPRASPHPETACRRSPLVHAPYGPGEAGRTDSCVRDAVAHRVLWRSRDPRSYCQPRRCSVWRSRASSPDHTYIWRRRALEALNAPLSRAAAIAAPSLPGSLSDHGERLCGGCIGACAARRASAPSPAPDTLPTVTVSSRCVSAATPL
jgi:hypothetical protein